VTAYAELQVTTNFSFLQGASHVEELVTTAAELGHTAIAVTDRNTLAGVVRAHVASKEVGLRFVVGVRLDPQDSLSMLVLPRNRPAYGRLSQLLTLGKRRAPKGDCHLTLDDMLGEENEAGEGQIWIALPPEGEFPGADFRERLHDIEEQAAGPVYLGASHLYRGDDGQRLKNLADLAIACRTPLVATNDVYAHAAYRRPLQDVLTCIREHCTIDEAGYRLFANAERHLKPPDEMANLFADYPEAVARTTEIAEACTFDLDELRYEYPDEIGPKGCPPQEVLSQLAWEGAQRRYPGGIPDKVRGLLKRELNLVGSLNYASYFLTVHDIVRFARSRGILCQGRGSAANSIICYCLGITAVDPDLIGLLFERFVSAERGEPPDIDVDFEHERREEVIQYVYERYGRHRAGIAATVVTYRTRSAVREVIKVLGLSPDVAGAVNGLVWGSGTDKPVDDKRVREAGLDPDDPRLRLALTLADELRGFPRHLSQHVGGFVITQGPLSEVVPIGNSAMEERTHIEWDKDDLDALGILKVDVLGLGMLTCIRKAFQLIKQHYGQSLILDTIPPEDPNVYDMLCRADSVGVFQVESRAQMSMLPRLKPRNFYDLVVEVAIVRPGPIQGDMVHPYLRRRSGEEPVEYPSSDLEEVLGKTFGVPLFQEQAMRIAIVAAGFSPAEADDLRRAMATFRRTGQISNFQEKFTGGMVARGYEQEFAERCFRQIEGFGDYGFPESHAASFALLVYVSAWIKYYYPAVFACAILNSQPMGFYAPAQIVRDTQDHGVEVRSVDVMYSAWDCTLEATRKTGDVALRLGFRQIRGFKEEHATTLVAARTMRYHDSDSQDADFPGKGFHDQPPQYKNYRGIRDIWRRAQLGRPVLERLARADAYCSLGLSRREALWEVRALGPRPLPLFVMDSVVREGTEPMVSLPWASLGEEVLDDYAALKLTLRSHPIALLRSELADQSAVPASALADYPPDTYVTVAGLVTCWQRPGTASGVAFCTLEDEEGIANLVIVPKVFERYRKVVMRARLVLATGRLQRQGLVVYITVTRLIDLSHYLDDLAQGYGPPLDVPAANATRHRVTMRTSFWSRDFY
jgi:error-prone DNA polymerase